MRDLSNASVLEFNTLNSNNPIALLAEVTYGGVTYRFVNDGVDIVWDGETYTASSFAFDSIKGSTSDTLPEVNLTMLNVVSLLEILKTNNGLRGSDLVLYLVAAIESEGVWSIPETRADSYPLRFAYTVMKSKADLKNVTLVLGLPNYFQLPFPARLYRRDWCDFAYQEFRCWMKNYEVIGETDGCDHSYANCKAHYLDQSSPTLGVRHGGFPNLGKGSYRY